MELIKTADATIGGIPLAELVRPIAVHPALQYTPDVWRWRALAGVAFDGQLGPLFHLLPGELPSIYLDPMIRQLSELGIPVGSTCPPDRLPVDVVELGPVPAYALAKGMDVFCGWVKQTSTDLAGNWMPAFARVTSASARSAAPDSTWSLRKPSGSVEVTATYRGHQMAFEVPADHQTTAYLVLTEQEGRLAIAEIERMTRARQSSTSPPFGQLGRGRLTHRED